MTKAEAALADVERALTGLLGVVREALRDPGGSSPAPTSPRENGRAPAHALIVVDPGHGGSDPGAVVRREDGGEEILEKDLVVPYAMALREALMGAGYDVMLTRKDDTFVGLTQRATIANESGALCLVSLHANAASAGARNGAWVIYDDATTEEKGQALAESIFDAMACVVGVADGSPQREVFPDGSPWVAGRQLAVLSKSRMPAVLVELGFMTNPEDLSQLLDPESRAEVAGAIARGVINWHRGRLPK